MKKDLMTQKMAIAAVIGAAYAALTMVLAPISYGQVQFRISEVLCILPYFLPFTSWGLFLGCVIANLLSTAGILDVVFGSLATLISCLCMAAIGKKGERDNILKCALACLMPVLWNGVIVAAVLTAVSGAPSNVMPSLYVIIALQVAGGEAAVMYAIGLPAMRILPKQKVFSDFIDKYKN